MSASASLHSPQLDRTLWHRVVANCRAMSRRGQYTHIRTADSPLTSSTNSNASNSRSTLSFVIMMSISGLLTNACRAAASVVALTTRALLFGNAESRLSQNWVLPTHKTLISVFMAFSFPCHGCELWRNHSSTPHEWLTRCMGHSRKWKPTKKSSARRIFDSFLFLLFITAYQKPPWGLEGNPPNNKFNNNARFW